MTQAGKIRKYSVLKSVTASFYYSCTPGSQLVADSGP